MSSICSFSIGAPTGAMDEALGASATALEDCFSLARIFAMRLLISLMTNGWPGKSCSRLDWIACGRTPCLDKAPIYRFCSLVNLRSIGCAVPSLEGGWLCADLMMANVHFQPSFCKARILPLNSQPISRELLFLMPALLEGRALPRSQ